MKSAKDCATKLRAAQVRVSNDFSATPFKAKIAHAEREWKSPASSRRRLRLVLDGRNLEAVAVSVRVYRGRRPGVSPKAEVAAQILTRLNGRPVWTERRWSSSGIRLRRRADLI